MFTTVEEIVKVTGVTEKYVKSALSKFDNDHRTALTTIVQSYAKLPKEAIAVPDEIYKRENMDKINKFLKDTYKQVKDLKDDFKGKVEEKECWKALRTNGWDYSKAEKSLGGAPESDNDEDSDDDEKKPKEVPLKKISTPTHFTGPLMEMDHFWETEVEARCTLMNMNYGFMERNKDKLMSDLRPRLLKWVEIAGPFHQGAAVQYYEIQDRDEHTTRVIIKDVVRTFFDDRTRVRFENFLFAMFQELGTYAQPMSFVAAVCLLVLNEQETAAILRKIAKEYIQKHWAPEATGFATNAWLTESVIQKRFPDVASHFDRLNFWPDTYMQKILNALGIHVFPFDIMFDFLDAFMKGGFKFLVKFELSIIEHFRSTLLSITNPNDINMLFDLMRLDVGTVPPDQQRAILAKALACPEGDDLDSLDLMRMKVYDDKVAPRLAKAPKVEEFEPCNCCGKRKPDLWSDTFGAVNSKCLRLEKGGLTKDHPVEPY